MKLSRRTLLSTPLAVVAPVGEVVGEPVIGPPVNVGEAVVKFNPEGWEQFHASFRGIPFPVAVEISFKRKG